MADYTRLVKRILMDNDCYFIRRGKGDHDIWHSPRSNKNFPVDNAINDKAMANEVLKQAGIGKKF